jgi:hypothetical protein
LPLGEVGNITNGKLTLSLLKPPENTFYHPISGKIGDLDFHDASNNSIYLSLLGTTTGSPVGDPPGSERFLLRYVEHIDASIKDSNLQRPQDVNGWYFERTIRIPGGSSVYTHLTIQQYIEQGYQWVYNPTPLVGKWRHYEDDNATLAEEIIFTATNLHVVVMPTKLIP